MDVGEARFELLKLLGTMVMAVIDFPNESQIRAEMRDGVAVLNVKVADADLGKVIGKQGRTARSLRTILGAASRKNGTRFELNIFTDKPTRAETIHG